MRLFGAGPAPGAKASKKAEVNVPKPPRKRRRSKESAVRDSLVSSIPGAKKEVACSTGVVDVVTPAEIIEVKRASQWKHALGQVIAYSHDFPNKRARVHLFGNGIEHFRVARLVCEKMGVRVTVESESVSTSEPSRIETRETRAEDLPGDDPRPLGPGGPRAATSMPEATGETGGNTT